VREQLLHPPHPQGQTLTGRRGIRCELWSLSAA
jgi:hypothetical protein